MLGFRQNWIFGQKYVFYATKICHFSPQIFLTIFLVKSKLSTAKKSKTAAFSRVFHPKPFDNFSREIKVEFLDIKWRFGTVWHPEMMKYLPICTPPSLPINLMSLLCCDCLEGMRLEGHQGVLCVILAVRDWGWGAWCSSVCCWLWLAKKAWPKSVVSSSSSISRRLSCKKKDITNSSCFFVTFFQ